MTDDRRLEDILRMLKGASATSKDYEVGKNKPPKNKRWPPGFSGNPNGRPRGSKNLPKSNQGENLETLILRKGASPIQSKDGSLKMPRTEAVLESITTSALKGIGRSQQLYIDLLLRAEKSKERRKQELLSVVIEYKTGWEIELNERARLGIKDGPKPFIHPDDIWLYPEGFALIFNVFTDEERSNNRDYKLRLDLLVKTISRLKTDLADPKMQGYHQSIDARLKGYERERDKLDELLAWVPPPFAVGLD